MIDIENTHKVELGNKKSAWPFIETQLLLLLVYNTC